MADLALAELAQLLLSGLLSLFGAHHGQKFLAKELVGDTEYLHIGDFGMANEEFLDLAWIDILTAANDHILEAANNVDIALCIHCCQVPAMQPTIAINGLSSLLRHFVVALHDEEAAIT